MAHTIPSPADHSTDALVLAGFSTPVLAPIDLAIAAGECVCLSGPSGSGKTLLLRAIADLDPHAGEARCEGQCCAAMNAAAWRRQVALVPTESAWWTERVGDHFTRIPEAARLERLGFTSDVLDWQVARLSSGERQRLALLRALQGGPRILLLDEATANLDAGHTARVEQLLDEECARGLALFWVSHDPRQVARVADRYFVIEAGALTPHPLPA